MSGINGAVKSAGIKRALAKRDGLWCWFCGGSFPDLIGLTIDHYVPLSKGGTNALRNLRLACSFCNHRKGDLTAEEFETSAVLHERRRMVMRAALRDLGMLPSGRGYLHRASFVRVAKGSWQCPACRTQAAVHELIAVPCLSGR